MKRLGVWVAMGTVAMACLGVDSVAVGFRERAKVDVAADATVTQDAPVWVSYEGVLDKVGGGEWVLPSAKVLSPGKTEIVVRDGSVTIPADAGTAPVLTEPTAVLNKAVFWVDATRNLVTSNGEDGVTYVLAWKDARETKSAVPFDYPRAVAQYTVTNLPPQVRQNAAGQDMVYFGEYHSGRWMNFTTKDSENSMWTTAAIRHSFIVYKAANSYWYLLGSDNGVETYHPEGSAAYLGWSYTTLNVPISRQNLGARVYLDGTHIDATKTKVQAGCKLLEHDFCGLPGVADNFANGKYTNRQGGEDLCEVVLFTNRLSEVERIQVESWLIQKWGLRKANADVSFAVARGAALNVEGAEAPHVSGEGRIVARAAETRLPDMGDDMSFAGTLAPGASTVVMNDEVAVEAAVGQRIHTGRVADGDHLTVYSDAGIGMIAKSGAGGLRLESVPGDVKKIDVQSGVLTLAASADVTTVATGSTDAVIQDGSFETYTGLAFSGAREIPATNCGWTYGRIDGDTSDSYALIWNAMRGGNSWQLPRISADGECVMILRHKAFAYTAVTIPQDGTYELSFAVSRRPNAYPSLDVYFGRDADSLAFVTRTVGLDANTYTYQSVTLPDVKAGTYRLEFRCAATGTSYSPFFDDVKMRLVSRPKAAFLIPNGGFEVIDTVPVSYATLAGTINSGNVARGWSLTSSRRLGLALPGVTNNLGIAYQRTGDLREGRVQLFMASTDVAATATFKPTRTGKFRLQADVGRWMYTGNYTYDGADFAGSPCIHATIQIGDSAPIALGGLQRTYQRMETQTWPTDFTISDTNATMTLVVSNSVANGAAMLDNFAFLPIEAKREELIVDGGFETNGTWTIAAPERDENSDIYRYCSARRVSYAGDPQFYGYARYAGDYRLLMTDHGFATQEIAFPTAGRYRLRFHVSERADSRYTPENKGLCPYRAWIARDGVTNVIGRSTASTSNFVAHTWRFTVPDTSAPWTFGFEAVNEVSSSNKDRTVLIDGVSIVKDNTPVAETPDLPEKLEVSVAAGAELRLEFTGTNRIDRLTLGGRSVNGIISAATHPGYITGDGALEIQPKGTMILFR